MKKILFTTVLTVLVFLSFSQPKIQFDKTTYDFGNVPQDGGPVTGRFEFTNIGDSALILTQVKPGCGCTVPTYLKDPVPPGGRGYIDAKYTTTNKAGSFQKGITVTTNEPVNNKISLTIKGMVVNRPLTVFEQAGYVLGEGMVRIKNPNAITEMKNTETRLDTFPIKNFWNKDVEVKLMELPKAGYLKEKYRSFGTTLKTGEEGFIVFLYDASKRGVFGESTDIILIQTNDSIDPLKPIFYDITIREDFSKLDKKKLEKAPKISVDNTLINYEKVKMKDTLTKSVTITNTGKSKLLIRGVNSSDMNIIPLIASPAVSHAPVATIEPGKSMVLDVKFNAEKFGKNKRKITIISNDPTQDVLLINVEAETVK